MKVALLWNNESPLVAATVRHDLYADGFESLGHEVDIVCLESASAGFPRRLATYPRPEDPTHPDFWRALSPDVVVMVTWLVKGQEAAAARAAGAAVVALADSDGQVGFGRHRNHVLYRSVMQHSTFTARAAALKFFGQRWLGHKQEVRRTLESMTASDIVVVNTAAAARNLTAFLAEESRADLVGRIQVCPYPVDSAFLGKLARPKQKQMIAVGRWESPQKHGSLLSQALDRYYAAGGDLNVHIFGSGSEVFGPVARRHRALVCHGPRPPVEVAEAMSLSQILLLTSRWESGPIVAFEALCQGCSIVSTDLPNLIELVADGQFGSIAASRSPEAVSDAIAAEAERWERGERLSGDIADHWQKVFSPTAVCAKIAAAL